MFVATGNLGIIFFIKLSWKLHSATPPYIKVATCQKSFSKIVIMSGCFLGCQFSWLQQWFVCDGIPIM